MVVVVMVVVLEKEMKHATAGVGLPKAQITAIGAEEKTPTRWIRRFVHPCGVFLEHSFYRLV